MYLNKAMIFGNLTRDVELQIDEYLAYENAIISEVNTIVNQLTF